MTPRLPRLLVRRQRQARGEEGAHPRHARLLLRRRGTDLMHDHRYWPLSACVAITVTVCVRVLCACAVCVCVRVCVCMCLYLWAEMSSSGQTLFSS